MFSQFTPDKNDALFFLTGQAFKEFLTCYLAAAKEAPSFESSSVAVTETSEGLAGKTVKEQRREAMETYLEYRAVNDPAKRLLTAAFGKEWTEAVLYQVLFPQNLCRGS